MQTFQTKAIGVCLGMGMIGLVLPASTVAQFNPTTGRPALEQVDPTLPEAVKQAVLGAVAQQTGRSPNQFTLLQATARTWSDGCLGLGPVGQMCTAVLVRGWEVRVAYQRQEWVYRTNSTGEVVYFDPAGARLSRQVTAPVDRIPLDQRPSKVKRNVVFREIRTGGFAGVKEELTLEDNGRLVRFDFKTTPPTPTLLRTIPRSELKAFKKTLREAYFGQFDGLSYPAPGGAADFFMVTLGDRQTTVQLAEGNVADLPTDLQTVLEAWRALKI